MSARRHRSEYPHIASAALKYVPLIAFRWLPDGRREGQEWVACSPMRNVRRLASLKINLRTGSWTDVVTGDEGDDVISLAAYLHDLSQSAAASRISNMLGLSSRGEA